MVTSVDWGPLGTALALQASLLCGWLRLTRKMTLSGPGPGGGEKGPPVESSSVCTLEEDGQGSSLGLGSHSAWTRLSGCSRGPSLPCHLRAAPPSGEVGGAQELLSKERLRCSSKVSPFHAGGGAFVLQREASQPDQPGWMGSIPLTGSASHRSRGRLYLHLE